MEATVFIILINIVILILIAGIIIFIFQYRKRKLLYEKEKFTIEEEHKAELLNTRLQIQTQTMEFIGREIHDSVAQKLTLASIYTQRMEFENLYPAATEKLTAITNILNDSLNELRDLSRTLTNTHIQEATLHDLLQEECDRVNDAGACIASFETADNTIVNFSIKSTVLRVVQEFMQNSLKHADCSIIKLQLLKTKEGLHLHLSDDGKGFDMKTITSKGIGLNNMKRRIQQVGGVFNFNSEPGKGTKLHLFVADEKLNG
jgi:signal transduction histidine kinase